MKTLWRALSAAFLIAFLLYVVVTGAVLLGLGGQSNGHSIFGVMLLTLPWSIFGMHNDPVDAHSPALALFAIPALMNAGILFAAFRLLKQKSN